jgi:hypothetical protein
LERFKFGWYKIFQALSLDVVIGAIIFSLAISKYYKVNTPCIILICLAIAIWVIYTCDHLLDAKRIKGNASTHRHQFHQKYNKPLLIATFVLSIIGVVSTYYLPKVVFFVGLTAVLFTLTL